MNRMFKNYPDIVTISDITSMLRIGKNSAYRLVNDNVIPSIKIGRVHKIRKQEVIRYAKLRR